MLKPNEIREIITRSNPYLRVNPDKMQVFIDAGHIRLRGAASLSYEYAYTLRVIVQDFNGHADLIILPLLVYLRVNQPELFENKDKSQNPIRFDIEFLNQECIDIALDIDLTERVIVSTDANSGRLRAEHVPEPENEYFPSEAITIEIWDKKNNVSLGVIEIPESQDRRIHSNGR